MIKGFVYVLTICCIDVYGQKL